MCSPVQLSQEHTKDLSLLAQPHRPLLSLMRFFPPLSPLFKSSPHKHHEKVHHSCQEECKNLTSRCLHRWFFPNRGVEPRATAELLLDKGRMRGGYVTDTPVRRAFLMPKILVTILRYNSTPLSIQVCHPNHSWCRPFPPPKIVICVG